MAEVSLSQGAEMTGLRKKENQARRRDEEEDEAVMVMVRVE